MAKQHTCAIIVAAGNSRRMGQNKLLLPLGNTTVIEYCLRNFQAADLVDAIVVVSSPELMKTIQLLPFTKICAVVEGGASRQDSVLQGLLAAPTESTFIAVHDGARPFVSPILINRIIATAQKSGAAAPLIAITSTVKQINDSGRIINTVDREQLRLVQTPQVFDRQRYQEALTRAIEEHADLTDDSQLFERMGWPVVGVDGDEENIKLTTPADIALANLILQGRSE